MRRALLCLLVCCSTPSSLDGEIAVKPAGSPYCRRQAIYTTSSIDGTPAKARPTNTFSIVARDPVTGDLGVAVQSHWFSVGGVVTWAEAGVGAIATQSMAEPMYGARGLSLMRDGMAAPDALVKLLASDKENAQRQVAFVDARGQVAAHTGDKCIQHAGHHMGAGFSVQANLMANDLVVAAMTHAFEAAKGDLTERLLVALEAAQEVGGDIRGCQSAAILVVSGKRTQTPWAEKKLDLRVEDSPAPLVELRRLVGVARAYDLLNQAEARVLAGDIAGGNDLYTTATRMFPENPEMAFWAGVTLASKGKLVEAGPLLRRAFEADPAWIELVRRMPAAGLLPDAATAERAIASGQK